jgi:Rap guanine nucleotide exchange factor 4
MHHVMSQLHRYQDERALNAGQKWKLPPCGQPISLFSGSSEGRTVIRATDDSEYSSVCLCGGGQDSHYSLHHLSYFIT